MTAPSTVRRRAPGKLFIAGEYAVLEPGCPAILAAVDQYVTVTVAALDRPGVEVVSDLFEAPTGLVRRDGELVGVTADDEKRAQDGLAIVVSAIGTVDRLLAERGRDPLPMRIAIRSRLHRDGVKFGLGSSGAVTVAVTSAAAAYNGLELEAEERYRLAMLASVREDAAPSGGDLATSTWGGWIAYQAPDRQAVRELARRGVQAALCTPWPNFAVRRLPPPRGLAVEIGWTGEPISTSSMVDGGSRSSAWFTDRSAECVRAAIAALDRGDDQELLRRIRYARTMLAEFARETGRRLFTPKLTALCDAAEAVGGAAKPSGAGGGDCGIALLPAAARAEIAGLRRAWSDAGVVPLPVRVQSTEGSVQ